ncbi:MAG: GNAT family N-acetyltransferase [Chitinophagaceae bacterium]|nr:GNAT family N-acetyltransferase [Chitinophagaceae bacterium]
MVDIFLRELREEDALLSYQWRNDPEVWKFTGRRPDKLITEEIELTWIRNVLKRNNEKRFAICIEETNQYIGNIQLTAINGFDAEFHIFIGERSFWGKGIAQRATELISKYAFNELNIQSIYSDVKFENLAAIKVYERAGYKEIFRYDEYIRMAVYVADPPDKKLSVFIMTYNHEQFIEKALNSILSESRF